MKKADSHCSSRSLSVIRSVQQLYLNVRLYFKEGRCHAAALRRQICQTSQSNWSGPLIYVVQTQVTVQVPDLKQSFNMHTYKYCTHHIGTTKKRQTAFSGAVLTPFSYSVLCKAPKLGLPPLALGGGLLPGAILPEMGPSLNKSPGHCRANVQG